MGRKASLELRELWAQRLERQAASGLSISRFCEVEGISVNGFYSWKRRLKDTGECSASAVSPRRGAAAADAISANGQTAWKSPSGQQRSPRQANQTVSAGRFFQVPIVVGQHDERIEFSLVDGTVVRVPASNLGAIELVLKTLGGDPSQSISGGRHHA